MKILRLYLAAPFHSLYQSYYHQNKLKDLDYDAAVDKMKGQLMIYPRSFASAFRASGAQVLEVIADFYPIQKKWACENGYSLSKVFNKESQIALFLKQIEAFRPDILYLERSGAFFFLPEKMRKSLKQRFPFLKCVTGHWAEDLLQAEQFRDMDLVFCMDAYLAGQFRKAGVKAEVLYFHFEEDLFDVFHEPVPRDLPFVFAGVSGYALHDHLNRYLLLRELMESVPLQAWCFENTFPLKIRLHDGLIRKLSQLPHSVLKKAWKLLKPKKGESKLSLLFLAAQHKAYHVPITEFLGKKPLAKIFPDRTRAAVFGYPYFALMQRAQITLNTHTITEEISANIRTFEATGMGSCLLTDRAKQMKHLFLEDHEIIGYTSAEEAKEKARYLLDHPKICQTIGENAKLRVKREHLFSHRFPILFESLQRVL